jgi:hypothetical protein
MMSKIHLYCQLVSVMKLGFPDIRCNNLPDNPVIRPKKACFCRILVVPDRHCIKAKNRSMGRFFAFILPIRWKEDTSSQKDW